MIDINVSFLFQLGLFWLVIILLNTLFFNPMLKYLDYRRNLIVGRKEEAEKILADIVDKEKYYNDTIRSAKEEGMEYKKAIREQIIKEQKSMSDAKQREIEEEFLRQKNLILGEMEAVKKEMPKIADDLGKTMAKKVIGRDLQ
ncbi:MAG: ATP synthase F0 subunit B [Proteobacteria bacterium]|nr:ATP synthase F0 subunit B [Pseudomonadota bacterium]